MDTSHTYCNVIQSAIQEIRDASELNWHRVRNQQLIIEELALQLRYADDYNKALYDTYVNLLDFLTSSTIDLD